MAAGSLKVMENSNKIKKIFKFTFFALIVFLIGGMGAVFFQYNILPKISTAPWFSKYGFLKNFSENVTIVNKTEEIVIKEENSINKIASQASAAVVNIISISEKNKSLQNPMGGIKNGTGIIVASDGLIATYRNAINEADSRYEVLFLNGSSHEAKLIGIDEFSNLAFLKIETSNLSVISFSNSNDFYPGKRVIAIGNSFEDYQNRYSTGILSNVNKTFNIAGKTLSSSEKLEGVFETDIYSEKDYLGGPIIDYNGELVGIIGSVVVDNQEIFFQIPSNLVKSSMDLAIRNELEKRPYLGIYYLPITKAYASANHLNYDKGALVYSPSGKQGLAIISGSPAEKAGIKINDLITQINGKEINLENSFSNQLSQFKKGDTIELTVLRDEQEIKIKIAL